MRGEIHTYRLSPTGTIPALIEDIGIPGCVVVAD